MHLDLSNNVKRNFSINDDYEDLGQIAILPLNLWKKITTALDAVDLQTCTLLNKNWRQLSVQMIGLLEFENLREITTLIFKNDNDQNHALKILDEDFQTASSLIQIKKTVHFQVKSLLKNCLKICPSSFPKIENLRNSVFFGNFFEILEVHREFKKNRILSTVQAKRLIGTLIKNRYVTKVIKIVAAVRCAKNNIINPFEEIVLQLFRSGYENSALQTVKYFIDKNQQYTHIVEELIKNGMVDQAFQVCNERNDKALFGTIVKAMIANGRSLEVPLMINLIHEEKVIPYIHSFVELIEAGYPNLFVEQIKKMNNREIRKILNEGLMLFLIENHLMHLLIEILEYKKISMDDLDLIEISLKDHLLIYEKLSDETRGLKIFYSKLKEKIEYSIYLRGIQATILETLEFQEKNPFIKKIFHTLGQNMLTQGTIKGAIYLVQDWNEENINSLTLEIGIQMHHNMVRSIAKVVSILFEKVKQEEVYLKFCKEVVGTCGSNGLMIEAMQTGNILPQEMRFSWNEAVASYYQLGIS